MCKLRILTLQLHIMWSLQLTVLMTLAPARFTVKENGYHVCVRLKCLRHACLSKCCVLIAMEKCLPRERDAGHVDTEWWGWVCVTWSSWQQSGRHERAASWSVMRTTEVCNIYVSLCVCFFWQCMSLYVCASHMRVLMCKHVCSFACVRVTC